MSLLSKQSTRKIGTLKKSKSKSIDIEYTNQDLPSLRRKRTIAYKRLTKALEVGILAANDPSQQDLFLSYHAEVKQIAASFEDAHFTILEILDDPDNEDNEIQERFDEMYYKILSINRTLTKGESPHNQGSSSSSNIRLPKITLPSFSGNIKQWPEYFDTFNALIHNSTSISDTEKFHYLVASLSGDALSIVKTFPMTHEYYRDAYEALTARYQSKRDLAFTCWREILNIEFQCHDAHEFRKSLDLLDENLCILKTINLPTGQWDFILVYHILSKLDTDLRRNFEEKYSYVELPSYQQLKGFLQSKCEALLRDTHFSQPIRTCKSSHKVTSAAPPAPPPPQPKRNTMSHVLVAASNVQQNASNANTVLYTSKCAFCGDLHSISSCTEFIKKSIDERMKIATDRNWCYNCLKASHQLKNCSSMFSCRVCKRKHHTLLHRDNSIEPNQNVSSLVSTSPTHTTVLLATAIVEVRDASGAMQSFRALFDTGSQRNFITESAVKRLNLLPTPSSTNVSGLGEAVTSLVGDVTCSVGINNKTLFTLDMHVISKICGDQPIAKLNTSGWSHINSLSLADPGFDIPGSIDILFAADVFAESLLNQHVKGNFDQPTAFNSVFGWLLLGKTRLVCSNLMHTSSDSDQNLNVLVVPERSCVFDASAKDPHSCSLNDFQLIAPKLQSNNLGNLLKFTEHEIVFMANAQQMYRKIIISPEHRDYQRIFWRTFPTALLQEYSLNTVTYEVSSSPFLACRTLRQLAEDDRSTYPMAKEIMKSDFNINNIVTGCDTFENAQLSKAQLIALFKRGGFNLRKWVGNDSRLLSDLTIQDCLTEAVSLDNSEQSTLKVLELKWDSSSDAFLFEIKSSDRPCIKRAILSELARIYDSLGFLSPITIQIKSYIQKLWILGIGWDQTPPDEVISTWNTYKNQLPVLTQLRISLKLTHTEATSCELHGFCDSSEIVYYNFNDIVHNLLWWAGPSWLSQDYQSLNFDSITVDDELTISSEERKAVTLVSTNVNASINNRTNIFENILSRFSSLEKLVSVLTFVNRFINNTRKLNQAFCNELPNNVERHNALRQMLPAFQQSFWSRLKTKYLSFLIQRAKHSKPLSMGSMVIVKDENRSPLQWTLARVVQTYFGADGIARSAVVRTANNNLIHRPLVKLYPLPMQD